MAKIWTRFVIPAKAGIQPFSMFLGKKFKTWAPAFAGVTALLVIGLNLEVSFAATKSSYQFNDSHFHLTNYIQEGTDIHDFLKIMGDKVGRVALFGIPLQQQWSYRVMGDKAPTYYLDTDSPLYYYSFTDATIAKAYQSLSKKDQARFDPMITGFNPTDMYAADHIRRVLKLFPGVFTGIGEFTIHKEFVSSKISGDVASLNDPALDKIFDLAAEAGLIIIFHNDADRPFAKKGAEPMFLASAQALFRRHPGATTIWAHTGMGRVVHPMSNHAAMLEEILSDPATSHVYFDISWDEVAKYITSSPETLDVTAKLISRYPDRFLFGTDEVAPKTQEAYTKVFTMYQPLLVRLSPDVRDKLLKKNYERLFDAARRKVRAWEAAQTKPSR